MYWGRKVVMENIDTKELDARLEDIRPDDIDIFTETNSKYIAHGAKAFYYYMKDVLESKNILLKDVYMRSDVTESYGGKIITMTKHTKNRDLIIRFCLAGHFSLLETNRALKLYGMTPLYSKNERDVVIIVAINNRRFQLSEVNELLSSRGFPVLSKE